MYLLELHQGDRQHFVGLFEDKEDAVDWIENLSYVHKQVDIFEKQEFVTYTLKYDDLPVYEKIRWKESVFPLTKYMFVPDEGLIEFMIWDKLSVMSYAQGPVDGMTQVDAYLVPNEEVEQYIQKREEMRETLTTYYEKQGKRVDSGGLGSQDGEYLLVDGAFLLHLDALSVDQWISSPNVDSFVDKYVEK